MTAVGVSTSRRTAQECGRREGDKTVSHYGSVTKKTLRNRRSTTQDNRTQLKELNAFR